MHEHILMTEVGKVALLYKTEKNWQRMAKQKVCRGKPPLGANLGVPGWVLPWLSPVQSLTAQQQCPDQHTHHTDSVDDSTFQEWGQEKPFQKFLGSLTQHTRSQRIQKATETGTSLSVPPSVRDLTSERSFSPVNFPSSHPWELPLALISTAVSKHPPSAALDITALVCAVIFSSISSSNTFSQGCRLAFSGLQRLHFSFFPCKY